MVRLDALLAVRREFRDPRRVLDRLRGVADLLVQLRERLERRKVLLVQVDDILVGVDRVIGVVDFVGVHLRDSA